MSHNLQPNIVTLIQQFCQKQCHYTDQMDVLFESYLIPLQKQEILSSEEHMIVFRNIHEILNLERQFRQQLQQYEHEENFVGDIKKSKNTTFERLVLKWSDNFQLYLDYFKGHKAAMMECEHQSKSNPKFYKYCQEISTGNGLVYLLEIPYRYIVNCVELFSKQMTSCSTWYHSLIGSTSSIYELEWQTLQQIHTNLEKLCEESKRYVDDKIKMHCREDIKEDQKMNQEIWEETKDKEKEDISHIKKKEEKNQNQHFLKRYELALKQLYNNEQAFLSRMNFLLDCYIRPIQSKGIELMSKLQFQLIFRNLNEIMHYVQQLFTKLKHRCDNLSNQTQFENNIFRDDIRIVGDIYLQFNNVLPKLQNYILAQPKAEQVLDELFEENKNWPDFYRFAISAHSNVNDQHLNGMLEDSTRPRVKLRYLLQSVCYRIVYYRHMFNEILKCIPNNPLHPDAKDLIVLLKNIEEVSNSVKDVLSTLDGIFITDLINDNVCNDKIIPINKNREFKCSHTLMKLGTFNQRNRVFVFVIFSDIVLYLSLIEHIRDGDKISSKVLTSEMIRERENNNSIISSFDIRSLLRFYDSRVQCHVHNILPIDNAFSVINFMSSPIYKDCAFAMLSSVESFYVLCPNATLKNELTSILGECIEKQSGIFELQNDFFNTKAPATLFVPDNYSEKCMIEKCNREFGKNNRGKALKYHCKSCGRLICGLCAQYQMTSWNQPDTTIRVCCECHDECGNDNQYFDNKNEMTTFYDQNNEWSGHFSKKIRKNDGNARNIAEQDSKMYPHKRPRFFDENPNQIEEQNDRNWIEMDVKNDCR